MLEFLTGNFAGLPTGYFVVISGMSFTLGIGFALVISKLLHLNFIKASNQRASLSTEEPYKQKHPLAELKKLSVDIYILAGEVDTYTAKKTDKPIVGNVYSKAGMMLRRAARYLADASKNLDGEYPYDERATRNLIRAREVLYREMKKKRYKSFTPRIQENLTRLEKTAKNTGYDFNDKELLRYHSLWKEYEWRMLDLGDEFGVDIANLKFLAEIGAVAKEDAKLLIEYQRQMERGLQYPIHPSSHTEGSPIVGIPVFPSSEYYDKFYKNLDSIYSSFSKITKKIIEQLESKEAQDLLSKPSNELKENLKKKWGRVKSWLDAGSYFDVHSEDFENAKTKASQTIDELNECLEIAYEGIELKSKQEKTKLKEEKNL